ncbi:transmembrane protein, putative [Bodo saltans]|uniref:Transmembrane protein, putative n=1 Tax=Bodo saltans TaxID=75058 RepID=A0A0S4IXL5_BODSA|nr:transmembrane protein, putative [Bodo saltans]|eukprot:CUG06706.1 transmembrane protein, putative [Bodo saltans]
MFDYKVGPIAVMWTTYMMLVGPTIGTSVGLLLVVESSGALRFTNALGVCVWTIPWGVCIRALCWRERRLFPFRGAAAKGRRLWYWFQKVTEPTEELVVARSSSISSPSAPAYARMLLQRYAPVFEG